MKKIVLISCVSKKQPYRAKAKDLYVSDLFKKSLAYARTLNPDKIFILSAKYGLVGLEEELEPYEQTLNNMKASDVRSWADTVRGQLGKEVDFQHDKAIFLAGEKYRKHLEPLFRNVSVPMRGMRIGEQMQWLNNQMVKTRD